MPRKLTSLTHGHRMLGGLLGLCMLPSPVLAQQANGKTDRQADEQGRTVHAVDPTTGRPISRGGAKTDIVDQSIADRYRNAPLDAKRRPEEAVDAYIALPPVSTANQSITQLPQGDRAIRERRLPGVTVRGRRRPEYDPIGFRAGSLRILPYVMGGIAFDSNVYAEARGRSDILSTATAGVDVRSDFGRHAFNLSGFLRHREYGRYNSEDATTYRVNGDVRLDLAGQNNITARVVEERIVLNRGVADEVVVLGFPTRYSQRLGEIGAHVEYGPVQFDVNGRAYRQQYRNNATVAGAFVDQSFRSFDSIGGDAAIGFDIGGLRSLYGQIDFERRRFPTQAGPVDRDADVYKIMGGFRGGLTQLIRGHVAVGYMKVDFQQANVAPLKTLAIDAELDWLFTERTTFSIAAKRDLRTVAQNNSRGMVLTRVAGQVDHEVLRNLILSLIVQQQWTNYIADPRKATATGVTLGATWLFDRHWQARPQIVYLDRRDNGFFVVDASPEDVSLGLDVTYRF